MRIDDRLRQQRHPVCSITVIIRRIFPLWHTMVTRICSGYLIPYGSCVIQITKKNLSRSGGSDVAFCGRFHVFPYEVDIFWIERYLKPILPARNFRSETFRSKVVGVVVGGTVVSDAGSMRWNLRWWAYLWETPSG